MSRTMAWLVYLAALVVLVIGYLALPALRPAVLVSVGVVSAAAIVVGIRRVHPERWGAWLLIAVALVLLAAGDATFAASGAAPTAATYPDLGDGLYLAAFLPLMVGLLWLGRPRLPSRDWPAVLDTALITMAGSLVAWLVLVVPMVADFRLGGFAKVTAVAIWVGHAAVAAAAVRMLLVWRTNVASALLCGGVFALLVGDSVYSYGLVTGWWGPGGSFDLFPVGLGLFAFSGLCASAAWSTSMADVASVSDARYQLGPGRLVMLAVVLLVGPTALLVQATSGSAIGRVGIAAVSALVGVMVLARLYLSVAAYRRRVRRYEAARAASRALVVATTDEDVIDALSNALAAMLPSDASSRVQLVDGVKQPGSGTTVSPYREVATVSAGALVGELAIPVEPQILIDSGPSRVVVFTASMADLDELSGLLHALTEMAESAMTRIRLVANLQAAERERYFRTLVLTSTDVILISRNGRIDYATPSAHAMFGRDIRNASFARLVSRDQLDRLGEPQPWSDIEHGVQGYVHRDDGTELTVLVHRRDLTDDPTVNGIVFTLRDVTAEREAQRSLAYRASHDLLTGLANADQFRQRLREESHVADHALLAVLFIDLDDFKGVNDTFGHEVGDGLLITTANRIRSQLGNRDLAARMGGDEFAVLLRDAPDADVAMAVAQRISDTLAAPATVDGISLDCQASIGLADGRSVGDDGPLLRRADAALYAAKADGKGGWRQYQDGMLNSVRRRTDRRAELERLMHDAELTLCYQPIVELATGYTAGFEALISRTGAADGAAGRESTEEIVGMAEDTGLSVQLMDWMLAQALVDAGKLNPPGTPRPRFVGINLTARQLRQPDLVDRVRDLLITTGVSATSLVIEIAEDLPIHDDERTWTYLAHLRRHGVRLAIDHYGTGCASLNHLCRHGIDIVKIAPEFLGDIDSRRTRAVLDAVIGPIIELGLDPIAEGIDDMQTADAFLGFRCRYGQGNLYASAMPIENAVTIHRFPACDSTRNARRNAPQPEAPSI